MMDDNMENLMKITDEEMGKIVENDPNLMVYFQLSKQIKELKDSDKK